MSLFAFFFFFLIRYKKTKTWIFVSFLGLNLLIVLGNTARDYGLSKL